MSKRRLSLFAAAFTAAVLGTAGALPASAAPEPTGPGGVTDSALVTLIASVGDDVFSTTDVASLIDPTGTSTQHYGPYASGSPDSGTCNNDWAQDTFDRHFTVHFNPDDTITVVEQFEDGSFTTIAGPSPGACETNPGGTVEAGKTGSMHGYFIIQLPPGTMQTSNSPDCVVGPPPTPDCTTAMFINTHFTPCYPATCSANTFFDHYVAVDQELIYHEWKNASADRGGNSGDIANTQG
jgi:hypothetical protein